MTTAENTHRILITVKGGVAYVEESTVPFAYEIRDLDNEDEAFTEAEIAQQTQRAQALAAAPGVISHLASTLRDSKAALASTTGQIDQMKCMFPDEDRAIEQALEAADDAHDRADEAIKLAADKTMGMVTLTADQYRRIIETLTSNARLIEDAIHTHIYDEQNDDIDEENCSYHTAKRETEELIEALPEAA